ncbi:MAG: SpoIIE family protein phosphatase [Rhodospirillaceae bacterium]
MRLEDAFSVISSSIDYASRIQRAILPDDTIFQAMFAEHFIIWQPRDRVGGDMYWIRAWGDGVLLIVADCTGHGVPGAFMTLIATGALDRAQDDVSPGKPGALVQRMHQLVQLTLGQHTDQGESDDGLELGAVYVDSDTTHLIFTGARFDLFHFDGDAAQVIKGTKQGIGYRRVPFGQTYDETMVTIAPDSRYYMTSDGLIDQVGGARKRSFGKKRFKQLLSEIKDLPMSEQKERIEEALSTYQGSEKRRDDVSMVGFKAS